MRSWISACIIVLALCCPAAAAELTAEARQCFEWFSTLGYPDVKDAPWAEIWDGSTWSGESDAPSNPVRTIHGFILSDTGTRFRALQVDLYESTFTKRTSKNPSDAPCGYKERPFFEAAKGKLKESKAPFCWFDGLGRPLCQKGQTFFLAFACWRKGNSELAQQLFDEAARMGPLVGFGPERKPPPLMRWELEREIGLFTTGYAALQMGTDWEGGWGRLDSETIARQQVPRAELLRTFRKITRLYPANPFRKFAQDTAVVLERMVAENKLHKPLTQQELANLPLEKRIDELIFQLRDQVGIQPPCTDVVDKYPDGTTPAHQLVKIGYPAVPHLIKALGDKRFSRSITENQGVGFWTVGDCAASVLEHITGLHFYRKYVQFGMPNEEQVMAIRKAAEEWWKEFQTKGEKQILIDLISSGKVDPVPLIEKLQKVSPDSVKSAFFTGALNAWGTAGRDGFVSELEKLKPDPYANLLRERLISSWSADLNSDGAFDSLLSNSKSTSRP